MNYVFFFLFSQENIKPNMTEKNIDGTFFNKMAEPSKPRQEDFKGGKFDQYSNGMATARKV